VEATVRQYSSIAEVCDAAEALARNSPDAAVAFLRSQQSRRDFHPWGTYFILRHAEQGYEREDDPDSKAARLGEVRELAFGFFERFPDHQAAWPTVLRMARRTLGYGPTMARLLERMRLATALGSAWLDTTIMECLLNFAPSAGEEVKLKALAGKVLAPDICDGLDRLAAFLTEVRSALSVLPPATSWSFSFGEGPAAWHSPDGRIHVNLSRLGLTRIGSWELPLSAPFFTVLFSLFEWHEPDFDGVFLDNWASISRADACHSLFIQLILPHLPHKLPEPPKPVRLAPCRPRSGELWVRVGNGQVWALRSYLEDPEATLRAAQYVAEAMQAGEGEKLAALAVDDPWWPRCDLRANVARIALNAGWYASPETAGEVFRNWAERYKMALARGNLLSAHAHVFIPLIPMLPDLKTKKLYKFKLKRVLHRLDGASVVFATAFARQLQPHFDRGGVHGLWAASGIRARLKRLTCVEPPISAWPYRPHRDWTESFEILLQSCEEAISATRANVFVAACGGYGVPLVDEIHRRTGITCFYPGHIANMLFGIYTDSCQTLPFFAENRHLEYWVDGQLADTYPEVGRIDRGRYAATVRVPVALHGRCAAEATCAR
jgi:hypothetical protein